MINGDVFNLFVKFKITHWCKGPKELADGNFVLAMHDGAQSMSQTLPKFDKDLECFKLEGH